MEEIIKKVKEIKEKFKTEGLKISDEAILDCVLRITISDRIQKEKSVQPYASNKEIGGITDKQKAFLDKHNIGYPPDISSKEASVLIKELIEHINKSPKEVEY